MGDKSGISGGIRYNKDVWTLITGAFVSSAKDAVSYELDKCEKQLHLGVNVFHRSDANKAANDKLRSSETEDMCGFLDRLVTLLEVDMVVAYDLLGYYVLYEFRGSTDGMRDMISVEGHKNMLIQDIWLFYRSERMFLLKCINFLWTYFYDEDHKFHTLYADLLERHTLVETFQSLANQMVSVMDEQMPTASSHGRCMTDRFQAAWFISNMREQIQTIHNMIVYLDFYDCTVQEFEQLYLICKGHSFGYCYDPPRSMYKEFEYFQEIIGQLESILLLVALNMKTMRSEEGKLYADGAVFRRMAAQMEMLGTQQAHGPLILAWMALFVGPAQPFVDGPPDFFDKHGGRAFKLKVFPYLTDLLKSTTFQNTSKLKEIAFAAVENLLCSVLDCFAVETLVPMQGLFELTAAVLANPSVADRLWESERTTGLWLAVNEAARVFPCHFQPLANIVESLASCGSRHIVELTSELESLGTYMEASKVGSLTNFVQRSDGADCLELTAARHPSDGNPDVTFPAGTLGRFCGGDEPAVLWDYAVNFSVVLVKELSDLLAEITRGSNYVTAPTYARGLAAARCLHQLVENQCVITGELSRAIAIVFSLLDRFSVSHHSPGEILASCLDIARAMLISRPEVVGRRLIPMKLLPAVDISQCTDPKHVARGDFFYMRAVGFVVVNHECTVGKYPLLLAYLRFVDRVMQPNDGDTVTTTLEKNVEIILPCLVFVVTTVFPNYSTWVYENPDFDRATIAYYCLRMMHLILTPDSASDLSVVMDTLREQPRPKENVKRIAPYLLHQTALYSLLETDTSIALIKLIGVGDRYLQELMERQPDWLEGAGVLFTNNVILAMSVLNRVLLYKSTFRRGADLSNVELLLLSRPPSKPRPAAALLPRPPAPDDAAAPAAAPPAKYKPKSCASNQQVRMVNVIANYIFHSFNPKLPVMAVKLLKRFATAFSISLLSCLGPDGRQICQHFLFRLHSRREGIDLKVAILEMMTAGIAGQPGLSEAFLNLTGHPGRDWSSLDYVSSVLDQLQTAPESVAVTLHYNVIALVHALWTLYSQRVLDHLRRRPTFWDGICAPFFLMPVPQEIPVYSKIIVICMLDMKWFGDKMSPPLARNLKTFLDCDAAHFTQWSEFVSASFEGKNDAAVAANVEELALAWKNFLTVLVKFCPFELELRQKKMIVADTMKTLLAELQTVGNQTVIRHVADAMLVLITNWKKDCMEEMNVVTTDHLQKLLSLVLSSHTSLMADCKESLLAFALRLTSILDGQISADDVLAASVMHAVVSLASTELTLVINGTEPAGEADGHVHSCLSATLSVCLVERLVSMLGGTSYWRVSLADTKLVHQLVDAAQIALATPALFDLAVVVLDALLLLSYTEFAKTLVLFKVGNKLWLSLAPPVECTGEGLPWFMGKWSLVYARGLRLVARLLAAHGHHFVADAVSFVGIHEPHVVSVLLGIRYCVEPGLLRLAVTTLDLLQTLQQFGAWKGGHPSSFYSVNRCVVSTLDRCIAYLLQPHILRAAVECPKPFARTPFGPTPLWAAHASAADRPADFQCSATVALVMNRLLECINVCMSVLYPLGPSYLSVMTDILDTEIPVAPLVEATYLMPAVERDPQGRLTLGTILSVIGLCTRSIAQKGSEVAHGFSPVKAMQSGDKYLSALAVPQLTYALEVSLSLMLAQALVSASNSQLSPSDRKKIMLTFVLEMSPHVDNVKRFVLGEELERQLTPSPEKAVGGVGGLKRLSNGGRTQCARRLQFAPASPPKRALIDGDSLEACAPLDSVGGKALTLRPRDRKAGDGKKHSNRLYVQLMMILYQSSFQSAYR